MRNLVDVLSPDVRSRLVLGGCASWAFGAWQDAEHSHPLGVKVSCRWSCEPDGCGNALVLCIGIEIAGIGIDRYELLVVSRSHAAV